MITLWFDDGSTLKRVYADELYRALLKPRGVSQRLACSRPEFTHASRMATVGELSFMRAQRAGRSGSKNITRAQLVELTSYIAALAPNVLLPEEEEALKQANRQRRGPQAKASGMVGLLRGAKEGVFALPSTMPLCRVLAHKLSEKYVLPATELKRYPLSQQARPPLRSHPSQAPKVHPTPRR